MIRQAIHFTLNGKRTEIFVDPLRRLADVLREDLDLIGTKIGCNAGHCGACTILLDGHQACSCMISVAQATGRDVVTVEGLMEDGQDGARRLSKLQRAFHDHGAAQCGFCTPGMLIAAQDLLNRNDAPAEQDVLDALAGVLCRCTGYRKIIDAVLSAGHTDPAGVQRECSGDIVGSRIPKVDGLDKLMGVERYGADFWPTDSLVLRAIRSPHHHGHFAFGDFAPLHAAHPGLVKVLTAADILGQNAFGIYATGKDQPVFADGYVRYRGEAICALVGDAPTIAVIRDKEIPVTWELLPGLHGVAAALAPGAPELHEAASGNVLVEGRLATGDIDAALIGSDVVRSGRFQTTFVEHAYMEPEAGYAVRIGDRLEIFATTQNPYMDRAEIALIMGLQPEQVRVIPSSVGGGFGGKLDLSLQPMIATAAWLLSRPVRCVYTRQESMSSTTKRHPATIEIAVGATRDGKLSAVKFHGDYNTGAYASWGPTVAGRVPVHAMGPYKVPAVKCTARAIYTNDTPAGAFRGFGVPQAAIALEAILDDLAEEIGLCPLEFRYANALDRGSVTSSGQALQASVGLRACLDALRPQWRRLRHDVAKFNSGANRLRRGVGVACGWYGIGNTSLPNPSTMRIGIAGDGRITLYSGALDIGQGSNTVMMQICAEALGVPLSAIALVTGDTDLTPDAGKTSASRQTSCRVRLCVSRPNICDGRCCAWSTPTNQRASASRRVPSRSATERSSIR